MEINLTQGNSPTDVTFSVRLKRQMVKSTWRAYLLDWNTHT